MRTGRCYCGDIRYEIPDEVRNETLCHCSMCRGTTGAPCVAWVTVARASLRFTLGVPTSFRSSAHGTRSFCARCGTQLTFADDTTLEEIDVTICSLDAPQAVPPRDHTFTGSALPWMPVADGLPHYRRTRSEG
ncbi:MAG: GFA family protein [Gammaproteobacteria bacterium]